jgi:hypothetical protein
MWFHHEMSNSQIPTGSSPEPATPQVDNGQKHMSIPQNESDSDLGYLQNQMRDRRAQAFNLTALAVAIVAFHMTYGNNSSVQNSEVWYSVLSISCMGVVLLIATLLDWVRNLSSLIDSDAAYIRVAHTSPWEVASRVASSKMKDLGLSQRVFHQKFMLCLGIVDVIVTWATFSAKIPWSKINWEIIFWWAITIAPLSWLIYLSCKKPVREPEYFEVFWKETLNRQS